MRVTLDLPDRIWRGLAEIAAERGQKVGERLADEITAYVRRELHLDERAARARREAAIRHFHGLGWSDRHIGAHPDVGMTHTGVKRVRDRLGLAANFKPFSTKENS